MRGPNFATCSACATANHAIGEAWRAIKMGDAQVMFAGGAEAAIVPIGIGGFCAMKAMSRATMIPSTPRARSTRNATASSWAKARASLCSKNWNTPKNAARKFIAKSSATATPPTRYHLTAPSPDGEGAARCMKMALNNGGLNLEDVSYINAHGTSTPQGDVCETQAIKTVFGERAKKIAVSSTKGATGHMLGAAGAVEMTVCALAIKHGIVPPTINYQVPDPECDLDYVPNTAREMKINAVINNSFGFGGHNASIAAKKFAG